MEPHRVELFRLGQPAQFGWHCLDCDEERGGYSTAPGARIPAERHGVVVDPAPEHGPGVDTPYGRGDDLAHVGDALLRELPSKALVGTLQERERALAKYEAAIVAANQLQPDGELRETVAATLAPHQFTGVNAGGWVTCLCKWTAAEDGDDDDGAHAYHLAGAVEALLATREAKARADALREAAGKAKAQGIRHHEIVGQWLWALAEDTTYQAEREAKRVSAAALTPRP